MFRELRIEWIHPTDSNIDYYWLEIELLHKENEQLVHLLSSEDENQHVLSSSSDKINLHDKKTKEGHLLYSHTTD